MYDCALVTYIFKSIYSKNYYRQPKIFTTRKSKNICVDNASIHKSKKMQAWRDLLEQDFNVRLYFLPPYSPELNRIEMLWRSMKYQWREFKWMPTDEIVQWVNGISRGFGNKYLFTF